MINYILQVLLFQALFLAVYDFFLQKETFFKWNRSYLLGTPLVSFIIPLVKFETFQKAFPQEYIEQLPTVFLNPQVVIEQANENNATLHYISILFYVGLVIFALLFLIKLAKIIQLIRTNTVINKQHYSLVVLADKQATFSFFNYIFINNSLLKNEDFQIIKHELIHCKQKHTLDLLFFELLKIVLWFNPMVYAYQKRITLLHEYISDAEVVKESDKNTYFNKLLSETFSIQNISFINQFFKHSLIKKRIVMITKEKSKKMKQLKYLLVLPLLVSMLVFSSFENKQNITNEQSHMQIKETLINDTLSESIQNVVLDTINPTKNIAFALIEDVPIFPGCEGTQEQLRQCLQDKITEHVNRNFNSSLATDLNLSPGVKRIFVMFKISNEGNIIDVQARAPHKKLQEEAIRVVSSLPQMMPGKYKGKNVNVKYSLPIAFKVANNKRNIETERIKEIVIGENNKYTKNDNSVPFAIIENVPVFPGCEGSQEELRACLQEKITNHISTNFNSKLANGLGLESGVHRIFVLFKIDKEGNITGVKAKAPHQKLADEAIRVVSSLPKMIPGKQKGENVAVKYSLPIAFKVE